MGANNVLPSVPTFTAGSPSIAQLNALSYAVSFLVDYDVLPRWSYFMYTATQSVPTITWTSVNFDHVNYDSDGVAGASNVNLPNAKIVTQGYYSLSACVQLQATANTTDMYTAAFLATGGGNNPNLSLGTKLWFGYKSRQASSTAQAAADNAISITSQTPIPLYPADTLAVQLWLNTGAHTVDINANTSYIQGRFATKFTGHLSRLNV